MADSTAQFPETMAARLQELEAARATLMAELEASGFDPQFAETGRWSINEVAYHLYLVEKRITGLLKMLLGADKRAARASEEQLTQEWELTRSRAVDPEIRSQAPDGTVPQQPPPFAETVALLKSSRMDLLNTLNSHNLDDLVSVSAPHPMEVIGTLTGAGWLALVAHHETRHTRQIRNVKAKEQEKGN